ncbi:MAG: glycosyltransferase family 2 protein [Spirosomataceae bacterium]
MPTLSIIIVNYKTPELIAACVASIYEWTENIDFEIIIVNNASKADDEAFLKSKFSEIKWFETGYNAGFGRANNLGMQNAKGEYFLLLNSDTLIIDDSIKQAINRYKSAGNIAAAGAVQLNTDKSIKRLSPFYAPILRYSWLLFPNKKADAFIEKLIPENKYNNPEEIDFVPGAFVLLHRDIFKKTDGFDESFFMYGEDVEWSNRLKKFGKTVILQDCKFIHDEWGSSAERKQRQLKEITYFNRFDPQAQLSNLVWIRKQFGVFYYAALMLHYWLWIPLFYLLKIGTNLSKFRNPFQELTAQRKFAQTIGTFSKHFVNILFNQKVFYKF